MAGDPLGTVCVPRDPGRVVAHRQPAKLAALEGAFQTERNGAFNLGGFPVPGQQRTVVNIKVPYLLGLLAYDNPKATIRGLKSFPKPDRPQALLAIRLSFLGMVGIGTGLMALGVWFWIGWRRRHRMPEDRWTLRAIVIAGPLAFLAIELGWMVTELGRQPWIVYGVIRTKDAVTSSPGLGAAFVGFTAMYIALAATTASLLRRLASGAPAVPQRAQQKGAG